MKAVIFDMDGVIADSEVAWWETFNRLVESRGIRIPQEEWTRRFPGKGTVYIMTTLFHEHGFAPPEGTGPWLDKWKASYLEAIKQGKVRPIPGFPEFNRTLDSLGVKKAIATGSSRGSVEMFLKIQHISGRFRIAGQEEMKRPKPDPQIFLKAASLLGEPPGNCIAIEDAPPGIQAARAAGMASIALATTFPRKLLEQESPWLVAGSYEEIAHALWGNDFPTGQQ